ncbi:MAG TPA: GDP-L-fucose synthase [Chitinophagales bacterium]|nr:GDP-L-fucose synthase [Chitinophagales bacterium]
MSEGSKIYIAGHCGLVGSAILRKLKKEGYSNFILRTSNELDLRNQSAVADFFQKEKPEHVFLAAAKVGGIHANNTCRAEFIYDNLMIQSNVIHHSYVNGVKKLVFFGSSCVYPKLAPQPLKEEYLMTAPLEYTNEPYAVAKIAGIKMCQAYHSRYGCNFITLMPTNLYGKNDKYDLEKSHVLPALLRKFHEAKFNNAPHVTIWGTGNPRREFLHVDDLADAAFFLWKNYNDPEIINVGTGEEITIKELALMIKEIVGYEGALIFDSTKPDGTPRKLLDVSKLSNLGWRYTIPLKEGIQSTYKEMVAQHYSGRAVFI